MKNKYVELAERVACVLGQVLGQVEFDDAELEEIVSDLYFECCEIE